MDNLLSAIDWLCHQVDEDYDKTYDPFVWETCNQKVSIFVVGRCQETAGLTGYQAINIIDILHTGEAKHEYTTH